MQVMTTMDRDKLLANLELPMREFYRPVEGLSPAEVGLLTQLSRFGQDQLEADTEWEVALSGFLRGGSGGGI